MKKILALFDVKMWKFILVGIVNTLVGYGIMFGLYNLAHVGYWLSSAANYVLTSILSYFLNKYFTFKNTEKGWKPVFRFAINIAVCYGLAYGIAEPLTQWLLSGATTTLRDNVAMLVGSCFFVGFNNLGQRFFAFRTTTN